MFKFQRINVIQTVKDKNDSNTNETCNLPSHTEVSVEDCVVVEFDIL
jgi:hypothetical protein